MADVSAEPVGSHVFLAEAQIDYQQARAMPIVSELFAGKYLFNAIVDRFVDFIV